MFLLMGVTRVELTADGAVASSAAVFDRMMRVGNVAVTCGGIGGVGTRRVARNKGYGRQVLQGCIEFMQQKGYLLSALFGIPDFYWRFGFASALVGTESTVATRDAEAAEPRYAVRPMQADDCKAVTEIYQAMTNDRSGSCTRDPNTWRGFRMGAVWNDRIDAFVVVEGARVVGYGSYDLDAGRCAFGEVGYADRSVFSTLLAEAAKQALEKRLEKIAFPTPRRTTPFLIYCRRYGCTTTLTYPRHAHGMVRIINQTGLLQAVQPLWTQRLEQSAVAWRGTLQVITDLGTDEVTFGSGPSLRVEMPQNLLSQLMLGFRGVEDALFETTARVDPAAVPVLEALCPTGCPYMFASDRF